MSHGLAGEVPGMETPSQPRTAPLTDRGASSSTPAMPHPWDGFVAGPENALAHAGVLALARGEAVEGAPRVLVLHGPSGSGKSRLLRGLVGEWLLRRPGSALAHLEAEAFAAACAAAQQRREEGWAELRGRFRLLDLLVLDDLHALEHAPLALSELTHTLDALADQGAAVAVSARTGPGQWRGWPSRLVNRLVGGLAVRIDLPGLASRRRFLLERAQARGVRLSAGAVDVLAGSADGYRTLEGWLARLELTARVEGRAIDQALVTALLHDDAPPAPRRPTPRRWDRSCGPSRRSSG
jgi:chromosomal replication initiator protein